MFPFWIEGLGLAELQAGIAAAIAMLWCLLPVGR